MSDPDQFVAAQTDTVDVIMQSTYRVLQDHGYANLSIAKIADEAGLSKSALYNHYDGKNEPLLDFLSRFLDWFLESVSASEMQEPQEDLMKFIELLSIDPEAETNSIGGVLDETAINAFIELRAQAIHDEDFRRELLREEEAIHDRLVQIIRRGIADGVFRDVDPDSVAEFVLTVLEGTLFRYSLMNDATTQGVYEQLEAYLESQLIVPASDRRR